MPVLMVADAQSVRVRSRETHAMGSTITFSALFTVTLSFSNFSVSGFGSNARTLPVFPTLGDALIEKYPICAPTSRKIAPSERAGARESQTSGCHDPPLRI